MLTKIYRRFYVIIPVHFEDDVYVMVEKLIKSYYGRNYIQVMERKNDN